MERLKIKKLRESATVPTRGTPGSVGYDLYACVDAPVLIEPGETVSVRSGIAIELPQGFAAFVYARSGLGVKNGIVPANCVGVIDSDYRGEIIVGLRNNSQTAYTVEPNQRMAQMVITKCETPELIEADNLTETARGSEGFGSTGITDPAR